jgi:hypothetical protein
MLPVNTQTPALTPESSSKEAQPEEISGGLRPSPSTSPGCEDAGDPFASVVQEFWANQRILNARREEIDRMLGEVNSRSNGGPNDNPPLNAALDNQLPINLLRGEDLESRNARDFFWNLCIILFRNFKNIFSSVEKE